MNFLCLYIKISNNNIFKKTFFKKPVIFLIVQKPSKYIFRYINYIYLDFPFLGAKIAWAKKLFQQPLLTCKPVTMTHRVLKLSSFSITMRYWD